MNFLRRWWPAVLLLALIAPLAASPAQAITNADIAANGNWSPNREVGNCAYADPFFTLTLTPGTDDGGGLDYYAVVHADGFGNVLDVDIVGVPVGAAAITTQEDTHAGIGVFAPIAARPVIATLYDVGNGAGVDPNSAAGLAFALAGALLDSAAFDPIVYEPACANFPVGNAPGPVPPGGGSGGGSAGGSAGSVTFWSPNDDRLNAQEAAPLAVYCTDGGITAYTPDGSLVLAAPQAYIQAVGTPPISALLAEGPNGERLFRLTSGDFQVNARSGGQEYVFSWDACPPGLVITRVYDAATWELLVEHVERR